MTEPEKMPFTSHLEELRSRLVKSAIAVGICFLVCYYFVEKIFDVLTLPLMRVMEPGNHLIYTNLPEAFFTYLKAAFIASLILASPVILYQFWMFVAPGLYDREKRLALPIVLLSSFFFIGGALFGYFIVFPFGFKFFLGFASDIIQPMPSMKEYLNFSSKLLLAFGLIFELPLVLTFLTRLGIVSVDTLKRFRKYAILLSFVVAAILTPPDVMTQIMMAIPLVILYEVSIVGARLFGRKPEGAEDRSEDQGEEEEDEDETQPNGSGA
ncbi:MAG: twin-arginine translocase subunit TatC [Desulfobacteraceae bacterium]|nr:twin-arginine translocase subunit TatC [Desulfobacteraceae bacterium]